MPHPYIFAAYTKKKIESSSGVCGVCRCQHLVIRERHVFLFISRRSKSGMPLPNPDHQNELIATELCQLAIEARSLGYHIRPFYPYSGTLASKKKHTKSANSTDDNSCTFFAEHTPLSWSRAVISTSLASQEPKHST